MQAITKNILQPSELAGLPAISSSSWLRRCQVGLRRSSRPFAVFFKIACERALCLTQEEMEQGRVTGKCGCVSLIETARRALNKHSRFLLFCLYESLFFFPLFSSCCYCYAHSPHSCEITALIRECLQSGEVGVGGASQFCSDRICPLKHNISLTWK